MVVRATNKYKLDNDTFTAFAAEHLVVEAGAGPLRLVKVYEKYKEWKRPTTLVDIKKAVLYERVKSISSEYTDTQCKGIRFKEEGEGDAVAADEEVKVPAVSRTLTHRS
jgi:hypothetical protein